MKKVLCALLVVVFMVSFVTVTTAETDHRFYKNIVFETHQSRNVTEFRFNLTSYQEEVVFGFSVESFSKSVFQSPRRYIAYVTTLEYESTTEYGKRFFFHGGNEYVMPIVVDNGTESTLTLEHVPAGTYRVYVVPYNDTVGTKDRFSAITAFMKY